jgi:glutamyl-tRNA reductase
MASQEERRVECLFLRGRKKDNIIEPIRIGIIGTGVIVSLMHWPALALLSEDFRVVSLCNRTQAKAERLADVIQKDTGVRPNIYEDYHRMLACGEIDAVPLALPASFLTQGSSDVRQYAQEGRGSVPVR